jgi:lipopolysaccharide export system permease protein
VAVKSAGVSPLALAWPALVLVTLLSMATVWLNDVAFSWGRTGVERVLLESLEEIAYGQLRHQRSFRAAGVSITVKDVRGRKLVQPLFTIQRPGEERLTFTARTAELLSDPARGAIILRLDHPSSQGNSQINIDWPAREDIELQLEDLSRRGGASETPSQMPLALVPAAIEKQHKLIEDARQELASLAGFSLVAGNFDDLAGELWKARESTLVKAEHTLAKLKTEPHRRWASGFSCLAFVLVGIPMAIRRRHAEFLASFFACFLPILLLYYPLLVVGLDQAKEGAVPPAAVWTGNVAFGIWGVWLLRRVIRY